MPIKNPSAATRKEAACVGGNAATTVSPPKMHKIGCRCSTCDRLYADIGLEVAKHHGGLATLLERVESGQRKNSHLLEEVAAVRESQQASAKEVRRLKRCLASERHRHNSAKARARVLQEAIGRVNGLYADTDAAFKKAEADKLEAQRGVAHANHQREIDRRNYVEARTGHDQTLFELNAALASARKDSAGFCQACEAEVRDHCKTMGELKACRERIAELGCEAEAAATVAERHRQRADLAEAHADGLRRELEERPTMHFYDETMRACLALAGDWRTAHGNAQRMYVDREAAIRTMLASALDEFASQPHTTRVLRAVRVMLFPAGGPTPELPEPPTV